MLVQTWAEIPTVNVRNGMRETHTHAGVSLFPCFSFRRPVFWPLNVFLSPFSGVSVPCKAGHSVSQLGRQPGPLLALGNGVFIWATSVYDDEPVKHEHPPL